MYKRINRLAITLAVSVFIGSFGGAVQAQEASSADIEYQVKAGFIYNFLKFVSWPEEKTKGVDSWNIGILADESIVSLMSDTLAGKEVDGLPVKIFKLNPGNGVGNCHVVFVCRKSASRSAVFTDSIRDLSVLVVGESKDFARIHGAIGFVMKGQNLRLEINPKRAKQSDLVISGKLASLAELVEDKE